MIIVLTTAPNKNSAEKISKHLVEKKLAACINIIKIENSVYCWKNKVIKTKEFLLIIKTKKSLHKKLEKELSKIHPYKIPEIVCLGAGSSTAYFHWLTSSLV